MDHRYSRTALPRRCVTTDTARQLPLPPSAGVADGIVDYSALQRHLVWRPAVSARWWSVAHFWHDAHRQHDAWLLLPARGLRWADGDLAIRAFSTRHPRWGCGHCTPGCARVGRVPASVRWAGVGAGAHHYGDRPDFSRSGAGDLGW